MVCRTSSETLHASVNASYTRVRFYRFYACSVQFPGQVCGRHRTASPIRQNEDHHNDPILLIGLTLTTWPTRLTNVHELLLVLISHSS